MAVASKVETLGKRQSDMVTAYLPTGIKESLEDWAVAESRSVSSLCTYLLTQAVNTAKREGKLNDRANKNEK
ncbi:MAG: hypothetical protein WCQ26_10080 [Pseudanabaena sp. ELA748]